MGPFVSSFGNKYILVVMDYVSKLVESITLQNNGLVLPMQLLVTADQSFAISCSLMD